ncbi:MAG TPA: hypothetical protein VK508_14125 [Cyclobacteriaceae bacterium]|nr:hypothetical protein [Cyclobacteriaceae bacterium]
MKAVPLLFLICAVSVTTFAQQQRQATSPNSAAHLPPSERFFFGGGGSFSSGIHPYNSYRYNYISVSPLVGYRITMPWSGGIQLTYQTYRFPQLKTSLDQYGLAPFTQYRFGKLFGYGEFQMINVPTFDNTSRLWRNRLPIGIGFTQPIGSRVAINAVALYDVIYNKATSSFASPWVLRVYITAGGIGF